MTIMSLEQVREAKQRKLEGPWQEVALDSTLDLCRTVEALAAALKYVLTVTESYWGSESAYTSQEEREQIWALVAQLGGKGDT